MKTPNPSILAAFLAAALAPALRADLLVSYGNATASSLVASSTAANVTASALSGTATPVNQSFNGVPQIAWTTVNSDTTTTFAGAVVANNYFTFTLTPAEGMELNLSSITFTVAAGTQTTTSVRAFYLTTATGSGSLTGAAIATDETVAGGGTIPYEASTVSSSSPQTYTIDLSSFSGITTSQTFRIYVQTPTISQSLIFGSLEVNGTVVSAIPEPAATAAILGGAALGLMALRRCRRKRVGATPSKE